MPLASEFNVYLSNDSRVRYNRFLFNLLNSEKNFENVYSLLQERNDKDFEDFSRAVERTFERMNQHCKVAPKLGNIVFSFRDLIKKHFHDDDSSDIHFFTVNQDLLLENLIELREGPRGGIEFLYPGICYICGQGQSEYIYSPNNDLKRLERKNISKIKINMDDNFSEIFSDQKKAKAEVKDNQPVHKIFYYKLHGSSGWFDRDNKLVIIGAEKSAQIKKNKLISMYFNEFENVIKGKILLVVGYSFNDNHINSIISKSVEEYNTKVFYISPEAEFNNKKFFDIKTFIHKMFPYRLEKLLDYDCREDGTMPFETKEILRALCIQENE